MKLFNFFLMILNNQRGSVELGESTDVSEETTSETVSEDATTDQLETESPETDLESQLGQMEIDQGDTEALLNGIRDLGITRNGLPADFESIDEVVEYVSKGYDYTKKTQEFAEERKAFESEMQSTRETFEQEQQAFVQERAEVQETLTNAGILENILITELRNNYPDIFDEINNSYITQVEQHQRAMSNPLFDKFNQKIGTLEQQLKSFQQSNVEKQHAEIREGFENESSQLQKELGPKLRKLGVKPNWKEVQDVWAADVSGKMTVRQAFFAKHGDDLSKAMASQDKLNKTKLMSDRRLGGAKGDREEREQAKDEPLTQNSRYNRLREKFL